MAINFETLIRGCTVVRAAVDEAKIAAESGDASYAESFLRTAEQDCAALLRQLREALLQ